VQGRTSIARWICAAKIWLATTKQDKWSSPFLFAEGEYKNERPEEFEGLILRQAQDTQFCTTFGGQNWYRIRLTGANTYMKKPRFTARFFLF
jgi:hypothetical protein